MSFHQKMSMESFDEIHKLVRRTRISQFPSVVLINYRHETFSVPARIQIHLVRNIGFSRECHVGDVLPGMCFLKATK